MFTKLFAALSCLTVLGCATTVGNPNITDQSIVSQIQIGTSKKNDVQQLLGSPSMTSRVQMQGQVQEWWSYSYVHQDTNPLVYFPIIGLFVLATDGLGKTESASFSVYFDQGGIVRGTGKGTMDMNMGGIGTPTSINSTSESTVESPGAGKEPFRMENKIEIHAP
jgi:outer membrane protein assembly factor BamE (lipoprotein component of BamABCDE complex)